MYPNKNNIPIVPTSGVWEGRECVELIPTSLGRETVSIEPQSKESKNKTFMMTGALTIVG